jgi:hypothetical protein
MSKLEMITSGGVRPEGDSFARPAPTPRSSLLEIIKKIFRLMDTDNDGSITEAEGMAIGRIWTGDVTKARNWWLGLLKRADGQGEGEQVVDERLSEEEWCHFALATYTPIVKEHGVERAKAELHRVCETLEQGLAREKQQQHRSASKAKIYEIRADLRTSMQEESMKSMREDSRKGAQ